MHMKKLVLIGLIVTSLAAAPAAVRAEGNAPESIQFGMEALLLPETEETFDAGEILEITGEGAEEGILYSSYDDSVAEVSEDGVITAKGYGTTTIVAASAADDTVSTSMDVAVFDFYGTYSGQKTIEAMGCDIAIDLTLKDDGTFTYYRAPMAVELDGGGEMPELEDTGTYKMEGNGITFTGEELGEYTVEFSMDGKEGYLKGDFPTGGAQTEMELAKEAGEEETKTAEDTTETAAEEPENAADSEEGTETEG